MPSHLDISRHGPASLSMIQDMLNRLPTVLNKQVFLSVLVSIEFRLKY